jgi:hypothetical protein
LINFLSECSKGIDRTGTARYQGSPEVQCLKSEVGVGLTPKPPWTAYSSDSKQYAVPPAMVPLEPQVFGVKTRYLRSQVLDCDTQVVETDAHGGNYLGRAGVVHNGGTGNVQFDINPL